MNGLLFYSQTAGECNSTRWAHNPEYKVQFLGPRIGVIIMDFTTLVGKTLTSCNRNGEMVDFIVNDMEKYRLKHLQDCCESVEIESIEGDLSDLIGSPIIMADESTSNENPKDKSDESFTWTFYKLATIKGYVTIRFYGSSNGYYSESASLVSQDDFYYDRD